MDRLNLNDLPSPCYVVDRAAIERNMRVLDHVQRDSGAQVLLALKGFAMWDLFEPMRATLAGAAASSLHEARLGREKLGKQVHLCAPAYRDDEFGEAVSLADHVTFNSFAQWRRFKIRTTTAARPPLCAIRINPQYSQATTPLYDPCAAGSRLGVTQSGFKGEDLRDISGLHFHTLCESNVDALENTLGVVERKFGRYFEQITWVNCGGGHHITREDYDVDRLVQLIVRHRDRYGHDVYLEPGEAIALDAGVLVTTVLDIVDNEVRTAVLDTSATAHMPDVLEMPYRPRIEGAAAVGEKPHPYRLGGLTCLAGDVIGDYAFDRPLNVGDKIVFEDMAHYTMVKNTMFNGVNLPTIVVHDSNSGQTRIVRRFGYEDYLNRLS